jgi:fructokinase
MYDVVAIGELLIDFTQAGNISDDQVLFERNPGGAPGNVLAILAKLGKRTALISKVGDDQFGKYLIKVLGSIGIDTSNILITDKANTTLAFVHLDSKGDRSFSFYRKPGADMLLEKKELNKSVLTNTGVFHFGSVSMTCEPSRNATLYAVSKAREHGAIITYDPNLRPPLWESLEAARNVIVSGLQYTDVLKVSAEELEFITGHSDLKTGSELLYKSHGIKIILVTLGPKGCFYRLGSITGKLSTYDVETVDTTGAGDAFFGAFIYRLLQKNKALSDLDKADMDNMVDFANAAGSLATTKKGAIPAMPTLSEIEACMNTGKRLEVS